MKLKEKIKVRANNSKAFQARATRPVGQRRATETLDLEQVCVDATVSMGV